MDSAVVLRSFHCSVGTVTHVQSTIEKPGMIPMCNVTLKKPSFSRGLSGRGKLFSPVIRKGVLVPCVKAPETTIAATPEASLDSSQGATEKKNGLTAMFPSGFEELVLEVCDETDVAELKLKIGDFEMNLKRNIGAITSPAPVVSHSVPAAVPSKPTVESASASSSSSATPSKSSPEKTSPFKNVSSEKSIKLASLEASGSNGYVIVSSPSVGSFRTGRTLKGKKQPPLCKVGDLVKEGQIIGYLDQFGSELPLRSDVSGEVLKLLYSDGEAIGYGDPLMAVLPSFHGIRV
ncbi:biotin/lipoyl attachment domain-containing protein [Thalictrum thalictroides]|uniref:Biotin/lipoyl attachment domain-containing protein n=1 Tax=Thalictrum thalictroides TaxID=46969 RepID=A0A7J6VJF5_THATH|nr:biotin/lipoyl attachment domain-containing protein [Thalictrum thalictroides]